MLGHSSWSRANLHQTPSVVFLILAEKRGFRAKHLHLCALKIPTRQFGCKAKESVACSVQPDCWPFLLFSRWLWLSVCHSGVVLEWVKLCMTLLVIPWILFSLPHLWTYFNSRLPQAKSFSRLWMSDYGLAKLNFAGLVGGRMKPGWWFGCFSWLPSGSNKKKILQQQSYFLL